MACKSCPVDLGGKLPKPKSSGATSRATRGKSTCSKAKSAKAGSSRPRQLEADVEEAEEPLAPPARPVPKPKKTLRAGGARGDVTEMAEVRPRFSRSREGLDGIVPGTSRRACR